jgi:hypothetical protein
VPEGRASSAAWASATSSVPADSIPLLRLGRLRFAPSGGTSVKKGAWRAAGVPVPWS